MLKWFKRSNHKTGELTKDNSSWVQHFKNRGKQFLGDILQVFSGKKQIDPELLRQLETILINADVGATVTQQLLKQLQERFREVQLEGGALIDFLRKFLITILQPCERPFNYETEHCPQVILVVGVNGAGKTTTIGKLAYWFKQRGKKVLLAAGDTFRAAAIEQLKIWGERTATGVIAQRPGADSAAVIFDALQAARARNMDLLIADTAGRLHTQDGLMAELQKVLRIIKKLDSSAPHEILLILDATIGQNALVQVKEFSKALGITGLCITKLDGTAKGGTLFAIAQEMQLPIYFVGIGEQVEDLQPFCAQQLVDALLNSISL